MPPAKKDLLIDLKFERPGFTLFCDKFAIRQDGEFFDLDFACSRSAKCVSVRMQRLTIEAHKESFCRFLKDNGMPETEAPEQARLSPEDVFFADLIGLARHGAMAEFVFHALSWKVAIDGGRVTSEKKLPKAPEEKPVINAFCVALIRSNLELQRHWIGALYNL